MNVNNDEWLIEDGILKEYRINTENTITSELVIPEGVREIDAGAFMGSNIRSVVFPQSLESIGKKAFKHTLISEVIIPSKVTYIGDEAFLGLNKIVFKGDNLFIAKNAFSLSLGSTIELSSTLMKQLISNGCIDNDCFGKLYYVNYVDSIIECMGEDSETVCYILSHINSRRITLKNVQEKDISLYISNIPVSTTTIFETSSIKEEDKIIYHLFYDEYDNTVLRKCISEKDLIVLPGKIDIIGDSAFSNCSAKTVILSKNQKGTHVSFLEDSNIENIGVYANGNNLILGVNKLKSIRFLSSDLQTLYGITIPNKDFDIYMPCGTPFKVEGTSIVKRNKLRIHIDFSNCNDYNSFINCLNNINYCFEDAKVYCYNLSPIWFLKLKTRNFKILNNRYVYMGKKSFSEYFNLNNVNDNVEDMINSKSKPRYKYSFLVQERIDRIKSLIEPINDDEENSINNLLNSLLEEYERDRMNFKPKYGDTFTLNLSIGPQSIRDLDINIINKLDAIINKLTSNANYIALLKKIDEYVKKADKENIVFDTSDNLTTDGKVNNILWYNYLIKDSKHKDRFKKELLEILKDISTSVSKELKMTFEESITLTIKSVDYNTLLETSIDELYNKAVKYTCWLLNSIDNKIDGLLSNSINNTRTLISLLDEDSKQRLSREFEEVIEKIKNIDLSLSKEEIIEYADLLLKPIREELDKNAYLSIKLKKVINGINTSLELLKTGDAVYEDTDIITDTVNEILSITPKEICETVKYELLRVIINWDNKLKNRDFSVSPNFDNMNNFSKSLLDIIEEYKLMFGEYKSSDIKVFKIMEEKAREGFVEVYVSGNEVKYIEILALYLTILKDLYEVKYKVECYLKEKEEYEKQFIK